jgi:hypothetical protein
VQWPLDGGTSAAGAVVLHLLANLDADPAPAECLPPGEVLWCEPRLAATAPAVGVNRVQLPPWLVRFSIDGLAAEAAGVRG